MSGLTVQNEEWLDSLWQVTLRSLDYELIPLHTVLYQLYCVCKVSKVGLGGSCVHSEECLDPLWQVMLRLTVRSYSTPVIVVLCLCVVSKVGLGGSCVRSEECLDQYASCVRQRCLCQPQYYRLNNRCGTYTLNPWLTITRDRRMSRKVKQLLPLLKLQLLAGLLSPR